ncbi:SAV_2336 N-terminal domain-related protein [Actinomadura madurae]|uniref:SAV_2336 N-terminal domain-related protein n=1 Tax=Actinomadura madurae TaxID=1993 RepID=UPI0020D2554C|nr:SAV_2336 N-terminal domain-related protein [Actinomadura madurae]MCQ0015910.1 hypothetical protein [Actinomadura madurae]
MIGRLVEALRTLDPEPTPGELADALWLADWFRTHEGGTHLAAGDSGEPDRSGPLEQGPPSARPPDPPAAPEREPPVGQAPEAGLYLADQEVPATAFPVRMPAMPAISGPLALSRALRPLRATVPSLTRKHLDEAATAERIAETGVCEPVMVAAQERRHDLDLVADVGPSMVVWRQTVEELGLLLQQLGAFRDMRTWYLDTGARGLSLRTGSVFEAGAERDPDELVDPTRRRLVLVVSDCIGAAWKDGRAAELLDRWGRSGTVAIVQPLPQRLWWRTAAAIEPVRFDASGPGVANEQLAVTRTQLQLPDDRPQGIPIPVVELSERWLRSWADMVARGGRDVMGAALFTGRPAVPRPPVEIVTDLSPETRVKQFRASSSPTAFKLATFLAAAPLRLPVMRLVQRAMLPTSTSADLAEVFLSGLLRMVSRPDGGGRRRDRLRVPRRGPGSAAERPAPSRSAPGAACGVGCRPGPHRLLAGLPRVPRRGGPRGSAASARSAVRAGGGPGTHGARRPVPRDGEAAEEQRRRRSRCVPGRGGAGDTGRGSHDDLLRGIGRSREEHRAPAGAAQRVAGTQSRLHRT